MREEPRFMARKAFGRLSETMRDCLLFWPGGHFAQTTRDALRARGLVANGELTAEGQAMREAVRESEP